MLAVSYWLPPDISVHGATIDSLIIYVHYFMALLFVGWGIFFVYCLIRFRSAARQSATYEPIKAKPSKFLEMVVVAVEAVLLVGFSIPVWAAYRSHPPAPETNPLEVHVIAQQFAWNVHYSGADGKFGRRRPELIDETANPIGLDPDDPAAQDDVTTINQFYIPVNRPVIVRLTSKDVIHSFSVPLLRIKQDVVPGMEIPIWFTATQTSHQVRDAMTETATLPKSADEDTVTRFLARKKGTVAMVDAGDVLKRGDRLTVETITRAIQAGVGEIQYAPADPVDIQCAQLCGLGHYRMRGTMQILDPDKFDEWYASAAQEDEFIDDEDLD